MREFGPYQGKTQRRGQAVQTSSEGFRAAATAQPIEIRVEKGGNIDRGEA